MTFAGAIRPQELLLSSSQLQVRFVFQVMLVFLVHSFARNVAREYGFLFKHPCCECSADMPRCPARNLSLGIFEGRDPCAKLPSLSIFCRSMRTASGQFGA